MNRQPARDPDTPASLRFVLGGLVHALTASGAVLAFLALMAGERGSWRGAMLWLVAAMIVDGIDGPLARLLDVKGTMPRVSGVTLDLVVDYLTYVFVPAVLVAREGLVAPGLTIPAVALMLLSALYHFARGDSKTVDNYFVGFPDVWNVVVFYLLVVRPGQTIGVLVIGLFAALTFAPVMFVHPVRVRAFQPWLGVVTLAWMVSSLALLSPSWDPTLGEAWIAVSLGTLAVLLAMGLIRTVRGAGAI